MTVISQKVWFPEPAAIDQAAASRNEDTLDWLDRCTNWKAKECRRFLNENLNALPEKAVKSFIENARDRWKSAFFELVVARTLQELGATVAVEEANDDGHRPDFKADFSDTSITVEAISPVINARLGNVIKRQNPLLEIVEAMTPTGWKCGVWELPDIGLQDSKREFKAVLTSIFANLPEGVIGEPIEVIKSLSSGDIRLLLLYGESKSDRAMIEPVQALFDDTKERIRYALAKKKRQVRSSTSPVLLAIDAAGISSELEDFDQVLFGYSFERVDMAGRTVEIGFEPDGIFTKVRNAEPTYAGVLAFLGLGFLKCPNPVLYRHPRFSGELPQALAGLENRHYSFEENSIEIVEQSDDVMERLGFVRRPISRTGI